MLTDTNMGVGCASVMLMYLQKKPIKTFMKNYLYIVNLTLICINFVK